jgi:hypothetical protein
MIGYLLPGFRDLRSALTSGFMWVAAEYLLVAASMPGSEPVRITVSPDVQRLFAFIGTGGRLVTLTMACLIVGECATACVDRLWFRFSRRNLERRLKIGISLPEPRDLLSLFKPMTPRSMRRLEARISRDTAVAMTLKRACIDDSFREIFYISPRLLTFNFETYTEFDRVIGEGRFRDAVSPPLPLVALALSLNINAPLFVKVILVIASFGCSFFLFDQGRRRFRIAHSMIAHLVADGDLDTPALRDCKGTSTGNAGDEADLTAVGHNGQSAAHAPAGQHALRYTAMT